MSSTGTMAKAIVNSFMRLMPIILYGGSALSGLVFNDFRGTLLFLGFLGNEFISLAYRMMLKSRENPQCALLRYGDSNFTLPSPLSQTVGFFGAFLLMKMYLEENFNTTSFFAILILMLLSVYSINNIGCLGFVDALLTCLVGCLFGAMYFYVIKDNYKPDYNKFKTDDNEEDDKNEFTFLSL
jgi:hypothetical protein